MKWFQFSLGRLLVIVFFLCIGCGFAVAAFAKSPYEPFQTQSFMVLRFVYSTVAAAAFGAAVGTMLRNTYNGFAIGVFAAFLFYLLGFAGLMWRVL
ncbi:MAG TPA: hypothetical protein VFE46_05800 [Pirellulales bacterium]|jgi:hypothetical protein|nr:hypothetical protein [Pirellulales bacterium]